MHPRLTAVLLLAGSSAFGDSLPNLYPFPNASGFVATYNAGGKPIDLTGPFFQSLGTNGRSCFSCHRPAQGWTVSPAELRERFTATQGRDPVFSPNDGSTCDHGIDTSTLSGRQSAYSLLLDRGLIRVALAVPANAEFDVVGVANPYGCNDLSQLSVYRRPLPSTNLRFLSTVMWDGRESSAQTGTQKITFATNPADLLADLAHQALDATNGHAQAATPLTPQQQQEIVRFEMGLSTAQLFDYRAGFLGADDARGGPFWLGTETVPAFFVGINDPLGGNPQGLPFTPIIFSLFDTWSDEDGRRASIARGQQVFNSKAINITGVGGLNDDLNAPVIVGNCGTCHDTPNAGNHSVPAPLNIGVSDPTSPLDVSYLPLITLQNKKTLETKTTTDPGRALVTGLWKDVGRVKGPVLRALASRPPYFHNGSAASLSDILTFYEKRFGVTFTAQERTDLFAFLKSL